MGLVDAPPPSTSFAAFHAAVLDLAGLLERPLVAPEVHAHGAPASVAVKPLLSHHHSPASSTATSSGSENRDDDDRPSSSGSGSSSSGGPEDFEGLNFGQVRNQRFLLLPALKSKPKEEPKTRQKGELQSTELFSLPSSDLDLLSLSHPLPLVSFPSSTTPTTNST